MGVHCVWLTSPEQDEAAAEEAEGEAETEETNTEGKALSGVRVRGALSRCFGAWREPPEAFLWC